MWTMQPAISISFSVSDNYSQHLAVAIESMIAANPDADFVFHVLHRNLSEANVAKLAMFGEKRDGTRIVFHKIEPERFEAFPLPAELEHVTREMYYRYLLPELLADETRTIYSDIDVMCCGDLRPLWETDLKGLPLAAVPDDATGWKRGLLGLPPGKYFCSGLLVMDLEAMRKENATRRLFETTAEHAAKLSWPDQDAINIAFDGRILELEPKWNCTDGWNPFRRDVRQWHFQGFTQKPWCCIWKNVTWPAYLRHLLRTPYRANAAAFVLKHVAGFFWYAYTKNRVRRYLLCGARVWKRRIKD